MPGIWMSTRTRSSGCSETTASASVASRAVVTCVPDAREDALEGPTIKLFVVDDEDVATCAEEFLRAWSEGAAEFRQAAPAHSSVPIPGPIGGAWLPRAGASRAQKSRDRATSRRPVRSAGGRRAAAAAFPPAHSRERWPPHGAGGITGGGGAGARRSGPRRRAAGPPSRAHQRPRAARAPQARAAGGGGRRDDRPREHRERRRLHPARRLRLPREALRRRPPGRRPRSERPWSGASSCSGTGSSRRSCAGGRRRPELVGNSPDDAHPARTIHSLRHNESHVLIQGESGTGKELVARAIHAIEPAQRPGPSFRSTAARCPRRSSRASSSATRRAPSPERSARRACSGWRTGGRSFWTRSGRFRSASRPSSCAPSRTRRCAPSGRPPRCPWTSA